MVSLLTIASFGEMLGNGTKVKIAPKKLRLIQSIIRLIQAQVRNIYSDMTQQTVLRSF